MVEYTYGQGYSTRVRLDLSATSFRLVVITDSFWAEDMDCLVIWDEFTIKLIIREPDIFIKVTLLEI